MIFMGINCPKLEVKDTPLNVNCNFKIFNCNFNYLNKQKPLEGKNSTKSVINKSANLKIFHQNIRGLRNKTDKLMLHLPECPPHVLCLIEHHLKDFEISNLRIKTINSALTIVERPIKLVEWEYMYKIIYRVSLLA